jgi:hypothetical protein
MTMMMQMVPKGRACVLPWTQAMVLSTLNTPSRGPQKSTDTSSTLDTHCVPPIILYHTPDTYPARQHMQQTPCVTTRQSQTL